MVCGGCKSVFYCGAECQANAWSPSAPGACSGDGSGAHKDECHLLAEVVEIGARLAASAAADAGSGVNALLVGKPIKRGASTSPEKEDRRETKRTVVSTDNNDNGGPVATAETPRKSRHKNVSVPPRF